jgi:hypothetical protein
MHYVPRKYKGTPVFQHVRRYLQRAATEGRFVHYGDLASLMGLPRRSHHMACETGHISGEISEHTHAQGVPSRVHRQGRPAPSLSSLGSSG